MDLAFVRAPSSPVIAEALDRSDGIYHRNSGELIAQGELGLPVFVGTMQIRRSRPADRRGQRLDAPHPGDIYIVNDPYLGGTHLMDVGSCSRSFATASCCAGSRTPATGPTPAAWCRAAFRPTPPRSSRRGCACRR